VKTFLINSLARSNFDGFETQNWLISTGRQPHERLLGRWSQHKVSQYTSRSSWLREDGEARRSSIVSTNPKARRNRSLTTARHTIGGAPPPGAFLAQSQYNLEEWFLLGLTCALVVRKRRGLGQQSWRAYQNRSINALVYHPQRTASTRLKVYTNIKLQDATSRIEDSISIPEGSDNPKTIKATREDSTLQDLNLRAGNLLTLKKIFLGILDSLTPLTLIVSQRGFDRILRQPQLSSHQL
jgi:hypothetical protein